MSGYTYLLLQTLPIVSAVALIFCLMGLFFGASKYRTQLKEAEVARKALAGELSALRKGQEKITSELDQARRELRGVKSGKAEAGSRKLGRKDEPPLEPAQRASDIRRAKSPVELGEIYESRPEQVDDLKKVRGIARVMEGKLNEAGIYTFAQIARWSDEAAAEFGSRLAIAGNIERYGWREQCATLHEEKYHEPA